MPHLERAHMYKNYLYMITYLTDKEKSPGELSLLLTRNAPS